MSNNIVFIHFLNDQILNIYKIEDRFTEEQIIFSLEKSFKYLVLFTNSSLYIPTVDIRLVAK
jgi:hypothetical protein